MLNEKERVTHRTLWNYCCYKLFHTQRDLQAARQKIFAKLPEDRVKRETACCSNNSAVSCVCFKVMHQLHWGQVDRLILELPLFARVNHSKLLLGAGLPTLGSRRECALAILGHQLFTRKVPSHLEKVNMPTRTIICELRRH